MAGKRLTKAQKAAAAEEAAKKAAEERFYRTNVINVGSRGAPVKYRAKKPRTPAQIAAAEKLAALSRARKGVKTGPRYVNGVLPSKSVDEYKTPPKLGNPLRDEWMAKYTMKKGVKHLRVKAYKPRAAKPRTEKQIAATAALVARNKARFRAAKLERPYGGPASKNPDYINIFAGY